MMGIHDLGLFMASGLLLNVVPGPDILYIVGHSTTRGARAGVVAALGIATGTLVHIVAAALGLSALLAASAHAFAVVKIIGALYLLYVGLGLLRGAVRPAKGAADVAPPSASAHISPPAGMRMRTVFVQGFLTNVLNPKVALFFLAFLPQFVVADAPSKWLAILVLGVIFDINGTLWDLAVAFAAAHVARRLIGADAATGAFARWFNGCVGALFVALGAKLACAKP